MQNLLQATKLAVRRQSANPSKETFDVDLLFGGKRLAFPCADVIGLQDVVRGVVVRCVFGKARRSRIRHQAAAGSWTMPRQWEIQRTWLNSARAAVRSPAKPNGV